MSCKLIINIIYYLKIVTYINDVLVCMVGNYNSQSQTNLNNHILVTFNRNCLEGRQVIKFSATGYLIPAANYHLMFSLLALYLLDF
jgi:hypothetical protein